MDIPFISYYSSILARLAYFDSDVFLKKYLQIFNIPEIVKEFEKIKQVNMTDIFDDDAREIIAKTSAQINKINLEKDDAILSSENVKYICISNSNYSSVYIIADKTNNTIFVAFRGTYSLKSMTSYFKVSSTFPFKTCQNSKEGYMLGIFKIVSEIFYTILESIHYLEKNFLGRKKDKLFSVGHSLGGACAVIFSFLWEKHDSTNKIGCVTFGSPRVLNGYSTEKMISLIQDKRLFFRRYINNGDPFPLLPVIFNKNRPEKSFYHVDDYDNESMGETAYSCKNIRKTKKVICNLKNKTKKMRVNIKYHETYLCISYKYAAQDLKNLKKEIKRNNEGDTICRIIVGGNNEPFVLSFFNLNDAKTRKYGYFTRKIIRFSKKAFVDYKHQDIYINENTFDKIIKEGKQISNYEDMNPLTSEKLVSINHSKKRKELFCL